MKMSEIKKDLQRKLQNTINEIEIESHSIVNEELGRFYAGGEPVFYERTGTLGTTPQVTDKYCTSNSAGVTVSLNQGISYNTGNFSGAQVIDAAEHGEYGIVGQGGFWERSEERIKEAVDNAVARNF